MREAVQRSGGSGPAEPDERYLLLGTVGSSLTSGDNWTHTCSEELSASKRATELST
jgi:hypothetical protein